MGKRKRGGNECEGSLARDRPARRRWQGDVVSKMRNVLLNCSQAELNGGRMLNDGEGLAATFDGKRLK